MSKTILKLAFLCLAAFGGARASVVSLPTDNLACGLYTTPYFGGNVLQDCTGAAGAALLTAPANGLQGLSMGYSGDVEMSLSDSLQVANNQVEILTMTTSGLTGGSGTVDTELPSVHYDFTIDPVDPIDCPGGCGATAPEVSWMLSLRISGAAVSDPDGFGLGFVSGTGTGEFLGDISSSSPGPGPGPSPTSFTVYTTAGENVKVTATLNVTVENLTVPGTTGTFDIEVPQGLSFDVQTANSIPEPGTTALMLAGFGLLAVCCGQRLRSVGSC